MAGPLLTLALSPLAAAGTLLALAAPELIVAVLALATLSVARRLDPPYCLLALYPTLLGSLLALCISAPSEQAVAVTLGRRLRALARVFLVVWIRDEVRSGRPRVPVAVVYGAGDLALALLGQLPPSVSPPSFPSDS
ncbi:hypothetical protein Q8F55_003355 [Vanrija albida]|uniref:Uncharacterized protein n=1 Tax=Vanrija albida TaxID=181172 RepID=A0ABR3Q3P8_9TREE